MQEIINTICEHKRISLANLVCKNRREPLNTLRQTMWYILYYRFKFSSVQIAAYFMRDHSTVLYGIKRIDAQRLIYKDVNESITSIEKHLS